MQRYWGSDDSDLSDGDKGDDKLKQVLEQAEKRKFKSENVASSPVALLGESAVSFKETEASTAHKRKKRKTKCSADSTFNGTPDGGTVPCDISGENSVIVHDCEGQKPRNKNSCITKLSESKVGVASKVNQMDNSNSPQANSLNFSDKLTKKHKQRSAKNTDQQNLPNNGFQNISSDRNVNASNVETEYKNVQCNKDAEMFTVIGEVETHKNVLVKRILPEWLANPTVISVDVGGKKSLLSELDYLDESSKGNLERLKINHLFPVQAEVVPWLMQSNLKRLCVRPSDICVSAPTGSGKTLAFVLPIIQSLKERVVCQVRALVVLPVSDLAVQVFKVFEQFCKGTDLHVALVVGKKSFLQEKESLVQKGVRGYHSLVDIVVATPGRLLDHISRTEGFSLEYLKYLVIDEADRMMEEIQQGFLKNLEKAIFKDTTSARCSCFSSSYLYRKTALPPTTPCAYGHISEPVQKLLYSATLSQDPEKLHELSLFQPKLFTSVAKSKSENKVGGVTENSIIEKYTTPEGLVEQYVVCVPSIKPLIVRYLIHMRNFKRVLCFTKTLESSHSLRLVLEHMGDIRVREISSSLQPVQRKIILERFSSGKIDILVCTDMMARGIDIENVDCVINYDAPVFIKNYVHRIGRTARAGRKGCAITLLENRELHKFLKMLSSSGKTPANPLEIDFESMKPMEEQYKEALASASKIIAGEKRNKFFLKASVKSVNTKKELYRNTTKNTKNGKFRNYVKTPKNAKFRSDVKINKSL